MSETEILTARIPKSLKRRIEAQAQEAGVSVSEYVCERLDRACVDVWARISEMAEHSRRERSQNASGDTLDTEQVKSQGKGRKWHRWAYMELLGERGLGAALWEGFGGLLRVAAKKLSR